ncbi:MAG: 50S ribosomal protein L11 [Candidatus Wildermuthbacteria bacterium RIFCSPHIGHO2_12_FULL_40_12]|uniref:Large ribosomal subunit protein uL11 n=1 Tax=Candidatus Wildermuthbacteria bacterium RIFCSPHIGHO2_12_FULL_40_12 TaxID=1802457 RepID=A0A1G2RG25_9BACT|nr:MAG: 50S ribosomal protein L11 [Candidatus Wildermuthbacteria bacterium RIFCSPHIGHO2_12_FULL_40_12]
MAKKIKAIVTIQIKAAQATPAPPVGPVLAQHGVNIGEFCQRFNDQTKDKVGFTIPAEVTIYEDRTYDLRLKQPPASELLKKAAGIEKGSGEPNKKKVAKINKAQLREIAQKKMEDLNAGDIEAAMKIIEGTAKNMGITIEN